MLLFTPLTVSIVLQCYKFNSNSDIYYWVLGEYILISHQYTYLTTLSSNGEGSHCMYFLVLIVYKAVSTKPLK